MNIGNRIKQRRLEIGLTVDAIAKKIGKDRATVYRYENNSIANVPSSILEALAMVLSTTPAYLIGWTNNPYPFPNGILPVELDNAHFIVRHLHNKLPLQGKSLFEKETGISVHQLLSWIRGMSDCCDDKLPILATFFGVTVDDLLGRTDKFASLLSSKESSSPSLTAAEPGSAADGYLTGDPSLDGFLSPEEAEHMRKYQTIPNDGKKRVDNVLDFEYNTFQNSSPEEDGK